MNKTAILSSWKACWGQSSLFECFDNCERDVAKWWIDRIESCEEYAHSQGYKEGLLKAVEVVEDARLMEMDEYAFRSYLLNELEALIKEEK